MSLDNRQLKAIQLLARRKKTKAEIAEEVNISRRQLYNWLKKDEFKRKLKDEKQELFGKRKKNLKIDVINTLLGIDRVILTRLNEKPEDFTNAQLISYSRKLSSQLEREFAKKNNSGESWLKIRYKVLQRDNFTCRYCGRTPLNHDIELHIDHIKPRAEGGGNEFDNLITSCNECNLGKQDVLLEKRKEEKVKRSIKTA